MKTLPTITFSILLFAAFAPILAAPESNRTTSQQNSAPQWNVSVEVLMIAMPQEKLLPLLPDLRDPKKIEGALVHLLDAVQRKEAILTGSSLVDILDGQRSISEAIIEKQYPTEFDPLYDPQKKVGVIDQDSAKPRASDHGAPMPISFETRNLGVTLQVEPHVSSRGESINMEVVARRVELLGKDSYDGPNLGGQTIKVDRPQFFTANVATTVNVKSGQSTLIGVHKLTKPEDYMEVVVLQAYAYPIK
jgi:hypothetical protein